MSASWRLIVDGPVAGARNMALDRAVQLAREAGRVPPTLRLYRWRSPTLTLGRFQKTDGIDRAACRRYGVEVVRRFTGGRGVLHDDEVTYAVVASVDDGIPRGVAASYRHFSAALVEAYIRLGIAASVTERDEVRAESSACYLTTTRADLSFGAGKLSGSAQVWHGATVLQHGSFTVSRDYDRETDVFMLGVEERQRFGAKAATIEGITGSRPEVEAIELAVAEGFSAAFGVEMVPGRYSEEELGMARVLEDEVRVLDVDQADEQ